MYTYVTVCVMYYIVQDCTCHSRHAVHRGMPPLMLSPQLYFPNTISALHTHTHSLTTVPTNVHATGLCGDRTYPHPELLWHMVPTPSCGAVAWAAEDIHCAVWDVRILVQGEECVHVHARCMHTLFRIGCVFTQRQTLFVCVFTHHQILFVCVRVLIV